MDLKKILIIYGDEGSRNYLKMVLRNDDYSKKLTASGKKGLTKAGVEKKLGIQNWMTMPNMGDNFTAANNLHEPVFSKSSTVSGALVMEQTSRQIIEMCKRAYAFEGR